MTWYQKGTGGDGFSIKGKRKRGGDQSEGEWTVDSKAVSLLRLVMLQRSTSHDAKAFVQEIVAWADLHASLVFSSELLQVLASTGGCVSQAVLCLCILDLKLLLLGQVDLLLLLQAVCYSVRAQKHSCIHSLAGPDQSMPATAQRHSYTMSAEPSGCFLRVMHRRGKTAHMLCLQIQPVPESCGNRCVICP